MAKEYIERGALLEELQEEIVFESAMYTEVQNKWLCTGLRIATRDVRKQPTADVVPRAEYEALQIELDAMRGAANSYKMHYEKAKAEVEEWKARANDWQNQYLKLIDENEIYQEHIDQDIIYTKAIRAEAIKELLERAEERVTYFEDECGAFVPFIDCRDLDAIAEELNEEDAE